MANRAIMNEFTEIREFYTPIQYKLIKILDDIGPITRKALVSKLGTPRTTIYDNLLKLQKRKLVEKFSRNDGKRGRPLVLWKLKN